MIVKAAVAEWLERRTQDCHDGNLSSRVRVTGRRVVPLGKELHLDCLPSHWVAKPAQVSAGPKPG